MDDAGGSRCGSPAHPCPSFNSYSGGGLADVAARVCMEDQLASTSADGFEEDDDDFEFVSLVKGPDDVLIGGGYAGPVFPVFNRDILAFGGGGEAEACRREDDAMMIPLKDLFLEDRDPPSCSSSEADELEGLPEGTYCVWTPRSPAADKSPARCKKSKSTGSGSKRWRLRDLMRRSNSDGKESFVFLTPASSSKKVDGGRFKEKRITLPESKSPAKSIGNKAVASAHEALYVRNRAMKEGDRRRSYLPYRKDLVGFFANANGLGRSFPPF